VELVTTSSVADWRKRIGTGTSGTRIREEGYITARVDGIHHITGGAGAITKSAKRKSPLSGGFCCRSRGRSLASEVEATDV
jgi:hypothetical protein